MRLLIGLALLGLAALAGALLTAGAGAQQRSLALEEHTPSSLTVTWHWDDPPAAAFELAWRARGDDEAAAWRSSRLHARRVAPCPPRSVYPAHDPRTTGDADEIPLVQPDALAPPARRLPRDQSLRLGGR